MDDGKVPIEVERAFGLLKGPCTSILSVPSIGAANARQIANHLGQIHSVLQSIPPPSDQHLPEPLVKYVVFVLFHVFRLLNRFTRHETRFDFLIEPWLACLQDLLVLPHAYAIVVGRSTDDARVILEALLVMIDGLPIVDNDPSKPASTSASPPTRNSDPRKMKKDRMADDVRLQAVRCLIAFIPLHHLRQQQQLPSSKGVVQQDPTGNNSLLDSNLDHPSASESLFPTRPFPSPADHLIRQQLLNPEDPRNDPVVGQMIVILQQTGTGTSSVQLRVAGMEAIDRLLHCFNTPSALARWMPGVLAGLASTMLEKGLMDHHNVHIKALQTMWYLIIAVLQDKEVEQEQGQQQGSPSQKPRTKEINAENIRMMMEAHAASADRSDNTSVSDAPLRFGTQAWMQKTKSALRVLFKRIASIRAHAHWRVRKQFGEFAFQLLNHCHESLGSDNAQFLLETLIACSQDDFEEAVAEPARQHLLALLTHTPQKTLELENVGMQVFQAKLLALPRVLHGPEEAVKQFAIKTLLGLVLFLGPRVQISIHQQAWETVQPWLTLLSVERLDGHHVATDRQGILAVVRRDADSATSDMQHHVLITKAHKEQDRWKTWIQHFPQQGSSAPSNLGFPRKVFRFLHEQSTVDVFQDFLRQLGFSTDIGLWYNELLAGNQGGVDGEGLDESTLSSIVLLNQLLLGAAGMGIHHLGEKAMPLVGVGNVAEEDSHSKFKKQQRKQQRHVRRIARDILGDYLDLLSKLDFSIEVIPPQPTATMNTTGRLGIQSDNATTAIQMADGKVHTQLACILLEGIASIAVLVGQDFEMELIRVLYPLLELLGDPDSLLVRESAEAALNHVAFATGYDSIGDMLNENYDYVVQQVSQRIAFITRNPKTPQVLISLIRVVGPRAVAMLEDSVTEIMIALDMQVTQHQGPASTRRGSDGVRDDDLSSEGLLKALCEIVRAMALEKAPDGLRPSSSSSSAGTVKDTDIKHRSNLGVRPSRLEEASVDVLQFAKQYKILAHKADKDKEEEELAKQKKMTPIEIRKYFMERAAKAKKEKEELFGTSDDEKEDDDDESFGGQKHRAAAAAAEQEIKEVPPTKHEALCLRIFNKAGYFLSSSSPRMRVLSLEIIHASIPVLSYRPREFYPAIHDLWGSIMARLRLDPEFFVSLGAIEVVTALADHCSDFLKKKLLDDVWPFILQAMRVWTRPMAKVLPASQRARGSATSTGGSASSPRGTTGIHSMFSTPSSNSSRTTSNAPSGKLFTREHRLQMTTLQSLSRIVRVIQAPVKDIWELTVLTCEFLDQSWFHVDVQEAAVQLIQDLARLHGDPVWLALTETLERDERRIKRHGEGMLMATGRGVAGGKIEHCVRLLRYLEVQQL